MVCNSKLEPKDGNIEGLVKVKLELSFELGRGKEGACDLSKSSALTRFHFPLNLSCIV